MFHEMIALIVRKGNAAFHVIINSNLNEVGPYRGKNGKNQPTVIRKDRICVYMARQTGTPV